jgi:hypothetical protein
VSPRHFRLPGLCGVMHSGCLHAAMGTLLAILLAASPLTPHAPPTLPTHTHTHTLPRSNFDTEPHLQLLKEMLTQVGTALLLSPGLGCLQLSKHSSLT